MAAVCPSFSPGGAFLSSMLEFVDCQAQIIGENGYRALASPASSLSPLLTLAVTIFVALLGYRFLIGDPPRPREAVVAAVKVGFVLMLATSWLSFKTLAYDVTMRAPAQLAQSIGEPAGLPGTSGGLNSRLQRVDDAMAELLVRGTGSPFGPETVSGPGSDSNQWIPFDRTANQTMLSYSRSIYLTSTIGAHASVRLVAGLLLALAPIFVLFLLFSGTRGLFEGWLRGLVGAIVGATAISIILAVEIALLEPWLASILSARRADISTPSIPVEIFVATLVFAAVLIVALLAAVKIAGSFRFPEMWTPAQWIDDRFRTNSEAKNISSRGGVASPQVSRAARVADAISATQRREEGRLQAVLAMPGRASLMAGNFERGEQKSRNGRTRLQVRRRSMRTSSRAQKRDMS